LSALLAPSPSTNASDAFTGSLVDPALALPDFGTAPPAALPASFFTSPSSGFDSASLPVPSAIEQDHAAPSPAASTSSKGKKAAAAPKKKRASAVEKVKALPLPEGVNTEGMTEEELNNLAIEEDKRRRNTAASGESSRISIPEFQV